MKLLALLLAALLLAACGEGDSSDDDHSASSGQAEPDDDDDDDDNDAADDDDNDADDDDVSPEDSSPSFNLGLVHYHYYGNLGGYDGDVFEQDQAWVARHLDVATIGFWDDLMRQTWDEIHANDPRGRWFQWESVHLFNTNESGGTCAAPELGPVDQNFAVNEALFAAFLTAHPEHGDGESCFLHARYDGRVRAHWHTHDCDIVLEQLGSENSAPTMKDARLRTLVWEEYAWLFDLGGDCARDWAAWKATHSVAADGFAGPGYDNLGSPVEDHFSVPEQIDPIDIIEIPDNLEASLDGLNEWWFGAVGGFLAAVRDGVREAAPAAQVIFNGATYCSWGGSTPRLASLVGDGIGVWCESALQYPSWGLLDTPDRVAALIDFSTDLADRGGFLTLETAYDGGETDPTAPEIMYYLAALYVLKHDGDALAIVPDWNPYSPLKEVCWFDVFGRDLGSPAEAASQESDGVFTRRYARDDGMETLVVVRADGDNAAVDFALDGAYCRVDADNQLSVAAGAISLASGDGLLLIKQGTGGVQCGKEAARQAAAAPV